MEDENSDSDLDILNDLISNETEETEHAEQLESFEVPKQTKVLTELQFNFLDSTSSNISSGNKQTDEKTSSEVYNDDIDSSDDEDRRYFETQKYSDYGRDIKQLIKYSSLETEAKKPIESLCESESKTFKFNDTIKSRSNNSAVITKNIHDRPISGIRIKSPVTSTELEQSMKCKTAEEPLKLLHINKAKTFNFNNSTKGANNNNNNAAAAGNIYSDPFFGVRIVNPLVSSTELKERMKGKTAVTVSRINSHIISNNVHNDWVIAGILIDKSTSKMSQKGNSYCIWKISDLSDDMKTVSIFLFNNAYKQLWKTIIGTVIGILNPNILENRNSKDQATLSIDNPQKMIILGRSKDMGKCKSIKKDGNPCTAIVNISRCEYCVYHIKQEYKKCSRRAELQSSNTAHGFTGDALKRMNKQIMRKPYNGIAPFVPILAKPNEKLYDKDRARLELLSETSLSNNIKKAKDDTKLKVNVGDRKKGVTVELKNKQLKEDFEKLNKLRGWQSAKQVMIQSSPNGTILFPNPIQENNKFSVSIKPKTDQADKITLKSLSSSPQLGMGCNQGMIDFSEPITKKHICTAKMNAIKWVQEHGEIKAKNPNQIRISAKEKLTESAKRRRENDEHKEQLVKKPNMSDKFKEMLEAKSSHTELIEKSYNEEKEKYFNKLEEKEKMEEKMMNTFKVDCKAVKCTICKYTAFSASDICKERGHPLCRIDAVKRFFKCVNCGNRTVSLNRMPLHSCNKCSSSHWIRAAMMDDKKCLINQTTLCIRGTEEKFLGSVVKDVNLNLLVPDTD